MAFNMVLWENANNSLIEIPKRRLNEEKRLEEWIVKDTSLLGLDILIIGRQVVTSNRGRIDLLAINSSGELLIIELKRDLTPREVVAQILDYASWIQELDPIEVHAIAQNYLKKRLDEAFAEFYETELPDPINTANHSMLIVASKMDDTTERIVQYLSARHGLDINVVFFTVFNQNGKELIGRSWLMDPVEVEERSERRAKAPWTGYWYVNVGEDKHRSWDDNVKYGFLAAGQGIKYSRPLKKLGIGDKVLAYIKETGYVGYGTVNQEAISAKEFKPQGSEQYLFDLPLHQEGIKRNAENENAEWVVGIDWIKTFPREQAQTFPGIFANQNIVCKLRDRKTFDFLKDKFGIKDEV